jgi:DNA replication protein DnaC|nr:MAG TPA: Replicative helicase [Caudoviricetes sp.]
MELKDILPAEAFETKENDGDYVGPDGLLYCGKCRTKKQTKLPASAVTGGREMIVPCICRCKVEENKRREEAEKKKQEMQRLERLRASSLMDAKLKAARLNGYQIDGDNQKIYNLAEKYVRRFDEMYEKKQGLLFWGTVGTGKSYTAACIANELLDQMIPVVMTSFVKILQNIQGNPDEEEKIMAGLNVAKLLIIDDLGAERSTDYALEKVYNIIDSRYLSGKPLILTTNMTLKEMQETQDIRYKRIYDRIFEMCFPVRFAGRSWREKVAAKRFDEMKNLMEE